MYNTYVKIIIKIYVCIILQHLQAALAGHALAALAAPGGVRVPSHPRHRLSWHMLAFMISESVAEHVNSQRFVSCRSSFGLPAMACTNANQCL